MNIHVAVCPKCRTSLLTVCRLGPSDVMHCSGECLESKSGAFVMCQPCGLALCFPCVEKGLTN